MASSDITKDTIECIQKYNIRFQKKFGQNFLIDAHVLNKIINAADISEYSVVLEIGPGIGTLTRELAVHAGKVIAVEIDAGLIPVLTERLDGFDNTVILHEDIMKCDIKELADTYNGGGKLKVVANLPYYITTPIIMGLLESSAPISDITVMVQKEVAMRMQAQPGSKDYGALSLAVQYYAKPEIMARVPVNCFIPRPGVDSTVIRLTCFDKPPVKVTDPSKMFAIIRASFNQRRKTLANALYNAEFLSYSKQDIAVVLEELGLSSGVRGEEFTLEKFAQLTERLEKTG